MASDTDKEREVGLEKIYKIINPYHIIISVAQAVEAEDDDMVVYVQERNEISGITWEI